MGTSNLAAALFEIETRAPEADARVYVGRTAERCTRFEIERPAMIETLFGESFVQLAFA